MALPQKYTPLNNFQSLDAEIGTQLDRNFTQIARNIAQLVDFLSVLARSDARIANATVTMQALSADLYRFIQGQNGNWQLKGNWEQGRYYKYGDIIQYQNTAYGCSLSHGANTDFSYDLNQGYWQILTGDVGASPTTDYVDTQIEGAKEDVLLTVSNIYLTAINAAATYITNSEANSTFLTIATAANSYLTLAQAAYTYATIASLVDYAPINSPAFEGIPTAPTPTAGDFSQKIATTEFVAANFDPVGSFVVFTADGIWTVPAGVTKCKATVVGGGGGDNNDGGTSSFGAYCSATGGTFTDGGLGSGGQINIKGGAPILFIASLVSNPCSGVSGLIGGVGGATIFPSGTIGSGASYSGGASGGGGTSIGVFTGFAGGQTVSITVGAGGVSGGVNGIVILEF